MSRIVLHSYVTNLLELRHPLHHFFVDIIEYDELSILPLVLQPPLDTCLFLFLDLCEYIRDDSMFVSALEIDIVPMLVFQRLDSLIPQTHDDHGYSGWIMWGRMLELRTRNRYRLSQIVIMGREGSHWALDSNDLRN